MNIAPIPLRILLLAIAIGPLSATARTLRLFTVGNSFSQNMVHYLPELAKEGGHELIIGRAVKGGCSLQEHWDALEAWRKNPADPKAKIYSGKSLPELLGDTAWDLITVQQYSMLSADVTTYRPYAANLVAYLKSVRPQAGILLHETWAYRVDADYFGRTAPGRKAASQREMYERLRAAYRDIGQELSLRIIPSGDAMWRADLDPTWGFRPDTTFDPKTAVYPALPDQTHSLHRGYSWGPGKKLTFDAHHANTAGEYLGALVWYGFLFQESPEKLTFVPTGVDAAFAAHLREVAAQILGYGSAVNRQATAAQPALAAP